MAHGQARAWLVPQRRAELRNTFSGCCGGPVQARAWLVPLLEDVNRKNQALSSYVIIATHVCLHARQREQQEALVAALLPATVPYLTTHHHNLRTFTQVSLPRALGHLGSCANCVRASVFLRLLALAVAEMAHCTSRTSTLSFRTIPLHRFSPQGAGVVPACFLVLCCLSPPAYHSLTLYCPSPLHDLPPQVLVWRLLAHFPHVLHSEMGGKTNSEADPNPDQGGYEVAGQALLRGLHRFLDHNADCARSARELCQVSMPETPSSHC